MRTTSIRHLYARVCTSTWETLHVQSITLVRSYARKGAKARLQEMAVDEVTNTEEGWMDEGSRHRLTSLAWRYDVT